MNITILNFSLAWCYNLPHFPFPISLPSPTPTPRSIILIRSLFYWNSFKCFPLRISFRWSQNYFRPNLRPSMMWSCPQPAYPFLSPVTFLVVPDVSVKAWCFPSLLLPCPISAQTVPFHLECHPHKLPSSWDPRPPSRPSSDDTCFREPYSSPMSVLGTEPGAFFLRKKDHLLHLCYCLQHTLLLWMYMCAHTKIHTPYGKLCKRRWVTGQT